MSSVLHTTRPRARRPPSPRRPTRHRLPVAERARPVVFGLGVLVAIAFSTGLIGLGVGAALVLTIAVLVHVWVVVDGGLGRWRSAWFLTAGMLLCLPVAYAPGTVAVASAGVCGVVLVGAGLIGLLISGWSRHLEQSNTVRAWIEAAIVVTVIVAWAIGESGSAWHTTPGLRADPVSIGMVVTVGLTWLTPAVLILARVRWSPGPVLFVLGVALAGVAVVEGTLTGTLGAVDPGPAMAILWLLATALIVLGALRPDIGTLYDGSAQWRSDRSWQRAAVHGGLTAVAVGASALWEPRWYLAVPLVLLMVAILLLASQSHLMANGVSARRQNDERLVLRLPATVDQLTGWIESVRPGGDSVAHYGAIAVIPAVDFVDRAEETDDAADSLSLQAARRMMDVAVQFQDLDEARTDRWRVGRDGDRLFLSVVRPAPGARTDLPRERAAFDALLERLGKAFDHRLKEPFVVDGTAVRAEFTIGYAARTVTAADDPATVQQDASWAARIAEPGSPSRFQPARRIQILHRAELAALFHQSLADGREDPDAANDLSLVFEPVVDLRTGATVGAEALTRWTPHGRRPVAPAEFLPIAGRTRGLELLGDWVLRSACRAIAEAGTGGAVAGARVAVNLSSAEVVDPALADRVLATLDRYRVHPSSLVLEIPETVVDGAVAAGAAALRRLAAAGVQLFMDDFGSAASGLSRLTSLPWSAIKLDRSILRGLQRPGAPEVPLIRAVAGLAAELGIATLAEGVEDVRTLQLAGALGCDLAQGWVFGQGRASLGAAWARHTPLDWRGEILVEQAPLSGPPLKGQGHPLRSGPVRPIPVETYGITPMGRSAGDSIV